MTLTRKQVKRAAEKLAKEFNLGGNPRVSALTLGGDPEFFFADKKGNKKGAERVIPKGGIKHGGASFVLDGFQAELRIQPGNCRALVGNSIQYCFQELKKRMTEQGTDLKADFTSVIEVDQEEMDALPDTAKQFGCEPSFNSHLTEEQAAIKVDPATYNIRGAGGHIHLGTYESKTHKVGKVIKQNHAVMADVLDVLLGNTCVLLDRDPMMAERRKVYGRSGEYRMPKHGIEYRVLSNFWLKAYPLMSFVFNLARYSVGIASMGKNYLDALFSLVDMDDIRKAIDENDFVLAYENFEKVCIFFEAIQSRVTSYNYGWNGDKTTINVQIVDIATRTLPIEADPFAVRFMGAFRFFVMMGIDYWFPEDPMTHWIKKADGHKAGWEWFSEKILVPEYRKWVRAGKPSKEKWQQAMKLNRKYS